MSAACTTENSTHCPTSTTPDPLRFAPPCRRDCPAHVNVSEYIAQITAGHPDRALAVIRRTNPFPSVCAYVCQHPCETDCNRRFLDAALNIRGLKKFAVDHSGNQADVFMPVASTGKRIAVIGAGPAGLTCAYFLSRRGHQVTLFDAQPRPGGLLRYGIPSFRLPRAVLDRDLAFILQSEHIELRPNKPISPSEVNDLLQTYDAVFLGIGRQVPKRLALAGTDSHVITGLTFLQAADHSPTADLQGQTVAVIGGGNTAIDCARTAIRRHAAHVILCCRRSREELRADPDEVRQAEEEGVTITDQTQPLRCVTDRQGKVAGLVIQKQGHADSALLPADLIVEAVGQSVDPAFATLDCHSPTLFVGGDARPDQTIFSVIQAVADGQTAAAAIHRQLGGTDTLKEYPIPIADGHSSRTAPQKRIPIFLRPTAERCNDRQAVEQPWRPDEACQEALRCLACDQTGQLNAPLRLYPDKAHCSGCRACLNTCPREAIHFEPDKEGHPYPVIDETRCTRCGLCLAACGFQSPEKHTKKLAVYGMLTRDKALLKKSSSGGIFAELAREVLAQHGVVFGAALSRESSSDTSTLRVRHIAIDRPEDLPRLQGSKYAPSDIGFSFREAKTFLDAGRLVFFTGVPCQIAGLKAYLKCWRTEPYPNLLTAAILCHGTPHPAVFPQYILSLEKRYQMAAEDFNFRQNHNENGRKFYDWGFIGQPSESQAVVSQTISLSTDVYSHIFFGGFLNRESCYRCRYCSDDRPEDITLGDFWGIEKEHPELFAPGTQNPFKTAAAVSCVAANTPQGLQWLQTILGRVDAFETTFEKIARYNQLHPGMTRGKPDPALRKGYAADGYGVLVRRNRQAVLQRWLLAIPRRLLPMGLKTRLKAWLRR